MGVLIGIFYIIAAAYAGLPNLDSDNEVIIKTSSSIFVEIASNPTTGYSWFFLEPKVNAISVKNLAGVYNPPPPGSPVGESGKQVFELVCNTSCNLGDIFYLTLVKKRPWEDTSVETRTVRVRVSNE